MRKKTIMDMEWLSARVSIEPNGCWRWTKSLTAGGYGQASVNGEHVTSHRAAFFIANGYWPVVARHKCDNRWCANPDHIENGTNADNARDFAERSNAHRGDSHERSKLSDVDVRIIKRALGLGFKNAALARRYGVDQSTISHIKRGARRRTR